VEATRAAEERDKVGLESHFRVTRAERSQPGTRTSQHAAPQSAFDDFTRGCIAPFTITIDVTIATVATAAANDRWTSIHRTGTDVRGIAGRGKPAASVSVGDWAGVSYWLVAAESWICDYATSTTN
jgi:hypothetical protein